MLLKQVLRNRSMLKLTNPLKNIPFVLLIVLSSIGCAEKSPSKMDTANEIVSPTGTDNNLSLQDTHLQRLKFRPPPPPPPPPGEPDVDSIFIINSFPQLDISSDSLNFTANENCGDVCEFQSVVVQFVLTGTGDFENFRIVRIEDKENRADCENCVMHFMQTRFMEIVKFRNNASSNRKLKVQYTVPIKFESNDH